MLAIYKYISSKILLNIIFFIIGTIAFMANFGFVYVQNLGATIILNDHFYARVFMNPLYHFFSFFMGVMVCFLYMRYLNERGSQSAMRNSFSSRFMHMII